jgi:8-oxo-dGTP pyrophosphatase MutT (NUDIX family)
MDLLEIERTLRRRLAGPLPGPAAQARMAPRPRPGWQPGVAPAGCRTAVVLLLVYPQDGAAHLVLTLRPQDLTHHAGQVSLPGGAVDPGEALDAAALREAREELGFDPSGIVLLGELTPLHVPVSGYVLHPRVGVARRRPDFVPHAGEVKRVLEVPVYCLLDPARVGRERRETAGGAIDSPYFLLGGERVWGATAMVLAEFAELLRPAA